MQATEAAKKAYEELQQIVNDDRDTVVGLWDLDLCCRRTSGV